MMSDNDFGVFMGKKLMNFAVGLGIAGATGVAAAGIGAGTANAAPSPAVQAGFAEWGPGWGPGARAPAGALAPGDPARRHRHLRRGAAATTTGAGTTTAHLLRPA